MRSLRACLLDEPLPRLMAMADLWDTPLEATSLKDVADSLATHLLIESNLQREQAGLPDEARTALEALLNNNGRMPLAAFERRFGAIRPMGPGKLERERPWLSPANAAEALWYRGFVYRAFDNKGTPTEMAFVPSDMLVALTALTALTSHDSQTTNNEPLQSGTPAQPDATHDTHPSLLLDDIGTLLCHIQNADVKVNATTGAWDAGSRRALTAMLKNADADRLEFLLHIVERAGFVRTAEGRLRLVPQPVTQWLQGHPQAQRDALYSTWLNDDAWNDLAHVQGISLQMTHAWSNDPVPARTQIVEAWQKWRVEGEVGSISPLSPLHSPPDLFVTHIKQTNPDFARPDGRYDTWHVRDEASGEFLHGFENWDKVEGALIRYVVEKPLAWLSLNEDTEDTEDKQDKQDRETRSSVSSPSSPSSLSISNTGRITLPAWLRFERFQLARVADWAATHDAHYDYVLTPRALARAREQGIRSQRVVEFLEQTSAKPLPDGVKSAITRWSEHGVEARMQPMVILKTQDAATMEALLRLQDVRRAVVDRFAPNCISILQRDAEVVRATILESGLMVDVNLA